jgi:hypothetical protein
MHRSSVRPASAPGTLRLAVSGAACVLVLATLAGCGNEGDDDPGTATDTSSESSSTATPSESPSPTDGDSSTSDSSSGSGGSSVVGETVEPGQAVVVSASNVKGEITTRASALVDDQALDAFLATTDPRLATDVRTAFAAVRVPADSTLFGAVVSVGCETPTAVEWTTTFDGIEVKPTIPKSNVQCLVPVTSVALFLVPN